MFRELILNDNATKTSRNASVHLVLLEDHSNEVSV